MFILRIVQPLIWWSDHQNDVQSTSASKQEHKSQQAYFWGVNSPAADILTDHFNKPVAAGWPCQHQCWCVHEEGVHCAPAVVVALRCTAALLFSEACPSPPSPSDDCAEWLLRCLKVRSVRSGKKFPMKLLLSRKSCSLPSNTLATSVLYDSNLNGVRKPREPRWNAMTGGTLPCGKEKARHYVKIKTNSEQ